MRRVYHLAPSWMGLFGGSAVVLLLLAYNGLNHPWTAAGLAGFAVFFLSFLRWRVELDDEGIEFVSLVRRRLSRVHIAGRRMKKGRGAALVLVADSPSLKNLEIPLMMQFDGEFARWLASIPDQEGPRHDAVLAAMTGADVDEAAVRSQRISQWLTAATWGAAAWGLVFPRPYRLAMLVNMALPLVALVFLRLHRGLYSVDRRPNDPRPSLAIALLVPGFILLVRAFQYLPRLLDLTRILWLAAGGALLLSLVIVRSVPRASRRFPWPLFALVFLAYAAGSAITLNCAFDGSKPQIHPAQVVHKQASGGNSKTYTLELAPGSGPDWFVNVPRQVFDRVAEGSRVAVEVYPGRLGIPWFSIAAP